VSESTRGMAEKDCTKTVAERHFLLYKFTL
jgi:hypothetical protein